MQDEPDLDIKLRRIAEALDTLPVEMIRALVAEIEDKLSETEGLRARQTISFHERDIKMVCRYRN